MTFTINVKKVEIYENSWKCSIELGNGGKIIHAQYKKEGKLECMDTNIKNEPIGWNTILKQVEEMTKGINIPNVETGEFGEII